MLNQVFFEKHLSHHPVIGIFRNQPPDETVTLCRRAWDFGVELVEIPIQSIQSVPSLEAAIIAGRELGKLVGAGTVTTVDQLLHVHELGAAFTVAPGLDEEVVSKSRALGLPHLPGIATATEIGAAAKMGLTWVKAFPASQLGPDWIRAQQGPFPDINFVATGGIGSNNARQFLDAGCRAVAAGSAFSDPASMDRLAAALSETKPGAAS